MRSYTSADIARHAKRGMQEGVSMVFCPDGEVKIRNQSKGTEYVVTEHGCSCPAGQRGIMCKHVSLVIWTRERVRGNGHRFEQAEVI